MKVSVVMSVYNESKEELIESITSILNQTYKNLEFIIVIDNFNNLEAINIIEDFKKQDERVKILINNKNEGLAVSLNRGIKEAKGIYIARMDADDISFIDRLEKQINYLEKNKDIVLLGTGAEVIDEERNLIRFICPETDFLKIKKKMKYMSCFIHPSVVFKKEIFEKLEGYRKFPCAQDYDFFSRILDLGYKVENLPEKLIYYRVRRNNLTNKKRLLQVLLGKYISKLSKERRKNDGRDSFNLKEIEKIEKLFEEEKDKFDKAREIIKKYRRNKILLFLNFPRIIFTSKYYLFILEKEIKSFLNF